MRFVYLDYVKGLSIVSVVWVHITSASVGGSDRGLFLINEVLKTSLFIPAFLVVSGILSAPSIVNRNLLFKENIVRFFKNILIPFYTINIMFFVINTIASTRVNGLPSRGDMLTSIVFLDIGQNLPSGVLWYFFTLFLCSFFSLVWIKKMAFSCWSLLLFSFFVKVFLSKYFSEVTFFSLGKFSECLFYYALGMNLMSKMKSINITFGKVMLLFLLYVTLFVSCKLFYNNVVISIFLSSAGVCFVLCLLKLIAESSDIVLFPKLDYLGKRTMIVYVFHMPVIFCIGKLFGETSGLFASFSVLLIAILLSLLIGKIIEFFPFLYKMFFVRLPK